MRHRTPFLAALLVVAGCASEAPSTPGARVALSVAPLELPGVTNACYTVVVANGDGETVWSRTDLCADSYGDGAGGVSYVGTCDAAVGVELNTVTLTLDGLYDASGLIAEADYANPGPLTRAVTCLADSDVAVTFDLTVSRRATQGFFDIAVSFEDVFCSAKLDCKGDDGQPIDLLFDESGQRSTTLVVGFSCTDGSTTGPVWLYHDAVVLDCGALGTASVAPEGIGNLADGDGITDPDDLLFGAAVHRGLEQLGYAKAYWNVLLGLRDVTGACRLTTRGTATGGDPWTDQTSPAGTTYPYVDWDVPVTDASGALICDRHPVGGTGAAAGVSVVYSDAATGVYFAAGWNGATMLGGAGLPSCFDGGKNGDETATDCGGSCVALCADGQGCLVDGDCQSGLCLAGVCATATLGLASAPAIDCAQIHGDDPGLPSDIYWLDPNGGDHADAFQAYCDMTTDTGGWTLVLQASSSSAYTYGHSVWTAASAPLTNVTDASLDQDMVSQGFYAVAGVRSMLCMTDATHCNAWTHADATARTLVTGSVPAGAQAAASACNTFECAVNTRPEALNGATSGTWAGAWHRFGYLNFVNGWGTSIRVGFSGDNDTSDSSDTIIGLGLACTSNCVTYATTSGAHGTGSGYYLYTTWSNTPHDDPLAGYLYVTRPVPTLALGAACVSDSQCVSGSCADGVCCDQPCGGMCETCAASGSEGTCVGYAPGTDPENECAGGTCSAVAGCDTPCPDTPTVLGCAVAVPGVSCNDIHTTTGADVDGFYWIDPTGSGEPYQAFCDMTTDGGGWTLVLQASSTSTYTYDATVWTATGTTSNEVPTPVADADRVSRAFYELSGGQSLLCMGDLAHCAGWSHVADTARNLANGPRPGATQATGGSCATLLCASNTFPAVMSQLMGGSSSDTYYRWGYVNDVNPWGTRTRVGFTGDGDSSDSSDTIIGLGVECAGANCPVHDCTSGCHNQGAGYYGYDGWNVAPYDNPLQGFLFVR